MDLPDWVYDEVILPGSPVAIRLVLALFRHGRPLVGHDGERRLALKGSAQQLARLAGVSKPHLLAAEASLGDAGFLTIHAAVKHNAAHAISAPLDRPSGHKLLPPREAGPSPMHDDDPDPSSLPVEEGIITTPWAEQRSQIVTALEDEGVNSAQRWLDQYGPEVCAGALARLDALRASGSPIRNPAGMLYQILTSSKPSALARQAQPEQPAERRTSWPFERGGYANLERPR